MGKKKKKDKDYEDFDFYSYDDDDYKPKKKKNKNKKKKKETVGDKIKKCLPTINVNIYVDKDVVAAIPEALTTAVVKAKNALTAPTDKPKQEGK